ncbi:hypothetical protein BOTBODRAFT_174054 [Botryobasidium botryosum FD-172 SS1]|uniref:Enoyl-CoA hydratase n=1 Tax=Botryobasidium botryosum (strain FD-172 SS1) TaxID=930990 RepID=A0A067MUE3_BOTB1|nr:hypothetical protein BOTBODRAFT_174054 [Botryobasidium botryosum FD-172 SS1]
MASASATHHRPVRVCFPAGSNPPLGILSHPSPTLWVIELRNGPDNRLAEQVLLDVIAPALDRIELDWRNTRRKGSDSEEWAPAALILTGDLRQNKFFSNGLLVESIAMRGFFPQIFDPVITRLLTFPIPTIAAINGHAFAGGLVLALACDYRIMTSGRAWCSMNEITFGVSLPPVVSAILQTKLPSPDVLRACALEGKRFTPQEALACEMVDQLAEGGSAGVLHKAIEYAERVENLAAKGVLGTLKKSKYLSVLNILGDDINLPTPHEADTMFRTKL